MRETRGNLREELIIAGIDEINNYGVSGFSIRRVAKACEVSCAAPYRHFENKNDFISAIIDYVNDLWAVRQEEILESCGSSNREKLVEICLGFVSFLMERPIYRKILMLHDAEFTNLYHKKKTPLGSLAQSLQSAIKNEYPMDDDAWQRKVLTLRSLVFGVIILFDAKEFEYNEKSMEYLRFVLNREFTIF